MNQVVDEALKLKIQKRLQSTLEKTIDNPVVKAHKSWNLLSDQLHGMLGSSIHAQWFKNIRPLVLKDNILLLQADSVFASQWINTHYQQLVDALILIQDRRYTCFFISPKVKNKRS